MCQRSNNVVCVEDPEKKKRMESKEELIFINALVNNATHNQH